MEVNIKKLKPHPLNIKLYGEEEVDEGLVASIKEKGILVPIVIKEDKTIISGHRRWVAAKKAGLKTIPARVATFKTKLSEKEAILDFNRQREKTFSQKMREGKLLEEIEGERAKVRQKEHGGTAPGRKGTLRVNLPGVSKGRAREIISKKVGIGSGVQYHKSKKIIEAAERDDDVGDIAKKQIEDLDKGKTSVHGALTKIKEKEQHKDIENVKKKYKSSKKKAKKKIITFDAYLNDALWLSNDLITKIKAMQSIKDNSETDVIVNEETADLLKEKLNKLHEVLSKFLNL